MLQCITIIQKKATVYTKMNYPENHDKTDIFLMFHNKLCFF